MLYTIAVALLASQGNVESLWISSGPTLTSLITVFLVGNAILITVIGTKAAKLHFKRAYKKILDLRQKNSKV